MTPSSLKVKSVRIIWFDIKNWIEKEEKIDCLRNITVFHVIWRLEESILQLTILSEKWKRSFWGWNLSAQRQCAGSSSSEHYCILKGTHSPGNSGSSMYMVFSTYEYTSMYVMSVYGRYLGGDDVRVTTCRFFMLLSILFWREKDKKYLLYATFHAESDYVIRFYCFFSNTKKFFY